MLLSPGAVLNQFTSQPLSPSRALAFGKVSSSSAASPCAAVGTKVPRRSCGSGISETMNWRTSQVPRAALLTEKLTVPKLIQAVLKKDRNTIKAIKASDGSTVFSDSDAATIIEKLSDVQIMQKLEAVEIVDKPLLIVTKAIPGQRKPMMRDFR